MEMSRENIRMIRRSFVLAAVGFVCLWKYDISLKILSFVWKVILPFVTGGGIAFVLSVPVNFIQGSFFGKRTGHRKKCRKRWERPISILVVLSLVLGMAALVLFGLLPQLGSAFSHLGRTLQEVLPELKRWVEKHFQGNPEIIEWMDRIDPRGDQLVNMTMKLMKTGSGHGSGAGSVLGSTLAVARSIVNGVATVLVASVFGIYLLMQKETLKKQVKLVLFAFVRKGRAEAVLEVCALTYRTFSNFLTGQCVEALILGSLFVVSMLILRLPYALLIGSLIAFTALIPVFGAFAGCLVGVLLIFTISPVKALVFVVLFLILQQVEDNLIYPHVVGNSVGLPSIWVLVAVSIGGRLMGVTGMLIFIPMMAVVYALFREIIYLKLQKQGIEPREIL